MPRPLAAAWSLALACGGPAPQASPPAEPAPQASPPAEPAPRAPERPPAPPRPPIPSTCSTPFVVPPVHKDTWVEQAAASPAYELGAWATRPMRGPSPDREALQPGCSEVDRSAAPPFAEIVHCATGDRLRPPGPTNMPAHYLFVRTDRGWWVQDLAHSRWPHRHEDGVQLAHVDAVVVADRLGDGGVEITALTEVGPPGGFKNRDVFLCGLGPSGVPACATLRVAAGGPFHGEGAKIYALTVTCDGGFDLAGWEGGSPTKLVHGRATLAFP